MMQLHTFFNSSAAFRVRIALGLKGIEWHSIPQNLRAGVQHNAEFRQLNPNRLVPVLQDGNLTIRQSLSIIDYLDRVAPEPRLIPVKAEDRYRVLDIALGIACDLHPINNLRVQKYLSDRLHVSDDQKREWVTHWLTTGFQALEAQLDDHDGWAVGSAPTLADCCVVPQVANALRASFDMRPYPKIEKLYRHCMNHKAFIDASPSEQPDYIAH